MISLKTGRVPVFTGNPESPIAMMPFPTKKVFRGLYRKNVKPETVDRYWEILSNRRKGATLADSGKPYGITREAVRQIEAKFIRLFGESLQKPKSSSMPETL